METSKVLESVFPQGPSFTTAESSRQDKDLVYFTL